MRQESTTKAPPEVVVAETDPIWQALADCLITLTMSKLLNLVPQFRQTMETCLNKMT